MQVNMHSELLVAYEVALEPIARFASHSTESFKFTEVDHFIDAYV
jgi:hypothetical protein